MQRTRKKTKLTKGAKKRAASQSENDTHPDEGQGNGDHGGEKNLLALFQRPKIRDVAHRDPVIEQSPWAMEDKGCDDSIEVVLDGKSEDSDESVRSAAGASCGAQETE